MAAGWMSRATGSRGRVIALTVACLTVSMLPLAARAQLPDPGVTLTVDDDGVQWMPRHPGASSWSAMGSTLNKSPSIRA